MTDISIELVLEIPFFSLSDVDIEFTELEKLTWRSYDTAETLPTTNRVELIDKREFTKAALDKNSEIFVIYITALNIEILIHLS